MNEHKWLYDTSNYPKHHPLYDATNKKVLSKMKDECGGEPIEEVVARRPKMYSIKKAGGNIKKAKGVKTNVIERERAHEHYKEVLFGRKQYMHKMKILRSEGHEMYGMCMNKTSISPFETKRWIAATVCTRWRTGTEQSGRRELCIRRHNKQLFTNKAALGTVRQIMDNRLVRFGNISFDLVNFQGPDRVSGSFGAAFKFAGLYTNTSH